MAGLLDDWRKSQYLQMAEEKLQGLLNIPTEAQRFITNPQAFMGLLGRNELPRETGFAAGATGLPPKNVEPGGVLNPKAEPYTKGYEQGEPFSYAAMALPMVKPTAKALAPKAGEMAEDYLRSIGGILDVAPSGRAKSGGQIAESNGFFYKGGQFLPTTEAEPGKWKINNKWVKSGDVLIEPGKVSTQPTPFSKSIYSGIKEYIEKDQSGKYKIKEGLRTLGKPDESGIREYEPVTGETTWTPSVNGITHKDPIDLKTLVDAYNNGQRWFDVNPDAITVIKKVVE